MTRQFIAGRRVHNKAGWQDARQDNEWEVYKRPTANDAAQNPNADRIGELVAYILGRTDVYTAKELESFTLEFLEGLADGLMRSPKPAVNRDSEWAGYVSPVARMNRR